jgi:hypothetical protein
MQHFEVQTIGDFYGDGYASVLFLDGISGEFVLWKDPLLTNEQEREELERRANKYTLPYFIVARAKMMLLAEQGLSNDEIANSLSTRREIVSRWRKRFFEKRLGGLEDFPRPGRPRVFPPRAGRAR